MMHEPQQLALRELLVHGIRVVKVGVGAVYFFMSSIHLGGMRRGNIDIIDGRCRPSELNLKRFNFSI